jgi:hypothetical protein
MAYMLLMVIEDIEKVDAVLAAWEKAGAPSATLFESSGLYRRQRMHIPMPYLYGSGVQSGPANLTLFSVVPDEETAAACLRAAEEIVGDLDNSNTGVFAAWPVVMAKGLAKLKGG